MTSGEKNTLMNTTLFRDIGTSEFESLIACLSPQIKHFSKGEIVILSGDFISHIGVMLTGIATAYAEHVSGNRTIMSDLAPLSVFGEILVSTRTHKSPVTVYAESEVTAAFVDYQKVYSMCSVACAAHRTFIGNLLKALADKYFILFDRINILNEKTLRDRIMAYLYLLSNNGDDMVVTIPYTKTMLADYLLANRSALSRELRKMEDEGIISVDGRKIKLINN